MTSVARPVAGGSIRMASFRDYHPGALARLKGDQVVSVCFPARDEAATIGPIAAATRAELVDRWGLVDEVLVLDDHSTDGTAGVAGAAGATVVRAVDVLAEHDRAHGKGEAVWRSLHVASGDLVAWCDADIEDFTPDFIVGLLGPLLTTADTVFVKGFYERPMIDGSAGGRVTELLARPLIAALFPELSTVVQPLSGEYAGRRAVLEELPIASGYGVDLALLIDVTRRHGADAVTQVDLGVRRHRNRSLEELGPQALEVLQAALARAQGPPADPAILVRPGLGPLERRLSDLPPVSGLKDGNRRRPG